MYLLASLLNRQSKQERQTHGWEMHTPCDSGDAWIVGLQFVKPDLFCLLACTRTGRNADKNVSALCPTKSHRNLSLVNCK